MADQNAQTLRKVFLGQSLQDLLTLVVEQGEQILRDAGVEFPIRAVPIVLLLTKNGPIAAADLAKTLGEPHQLVAQRLDALVDLKIVTRVSDAADARRKLLKITPKGRVQLGRLKHSLDLIEAAYARLFAEIDCDLAAKVLEAADALSRSPLLERTRTLAPHQEPRR